MPQLCEVRRLRVPSFFFILFVIRAKVWRLIRQMQLETKERKNGMVDKKEMREVNRSQTKDDALGVLAEMNAMLRKMPISEAVKKKPFERLQDRLHSLGWLGFCDEKTFVVKSGGCWTQLRLVNPESDEARAIP